MADNNQDKRNLLQRGWDAATGNNRLTSRGLKKKTFNLRQDFSAAYYLGAGAALGAAIMGAPHLLPVVGEGVAIAAGWAGACVTGDVLGSQISSLIQAKRYDKQHKQPPQDSGAAGPAAPAP